MPAAPASDRRPSPAARTLAFARARWPFLAVVAVLAAKQLALVRALDLPPGPLFAVAAGASAVAVLAPALLLRGRAQLAALALLDAAASALLLADLLYFRYFGDVLSTASIRLAGQLREQGGVIRELWRARDALLFATLPAIAALAAAPAAARRRWLAPGRPTGLAVAVAGGLALASLIAATDPTRTFQQKGHSWPFKRLGPLAYHGQDLARSVLKRLGRSVPDGEVRAIAAHLEARRALDRDAPNPLRGRAAGRSLLVVQVESLQGFVPGARFHGAPIAPNLETLARESITFPRFHHQAGLGVTSDADLLFNCSLYPLRDGSAYFEHPDSDYRCLPTILRERGYHAFAFQAIRPDFWNLAAVYPRLGYERFYSRRDYVEDDVHGHGVADASFLPQTAAKLAGLPEPWFAYVVTLTSHAPFARGDRMPPGPLDGTRIARYAGAIHETDRALGAFVADLRARGILDRVVLVVYGDHLGLSRGDDRYASEVNGAGRELSAFLGTGPDDEVAWTAIEKRVPLLVRLPGGAAAGPRDPLGGQIDLAPTILALLGVDQPRAPLFGRDLLAPGRGAVFFPDGSALDDAHLWRAPTATSPDGGCFSARTHAPVPAAACDALAAAASRDLARSRAVLEARLLGALFPQPLP